MHWAGASGPRGLTLCGIPLALAASIGANQYNEKMIAQLEHHSRSAGSCAAPVLRGMMLHRCQWYQIYRHDHWPSRPSLTGTCAVIECESSTCGLWPGSPAECQYRYRNQPHCQAPSQAAECQCFVVTDRTLPGPVALAGPEHQRALRLAVPVARAPGLRSLTGRLTWSTSNREEV
jgi:hypothetical protein